MKRFVERARRGAVGACLLVAGCSSSEVSRSTPPDLQPAVPPTETTLAVSADGLAATLERYREDDSTNTLQIQVINHSARRAELRDLQLVWPGMELQSPAATPHRVAPGQIIDLPVPAGRALCPDLPRFDVEVPEAPAHARATASFDDGAPRRIRIPITDTRGVLARLYVPGCQEQSLAHSAAISFGPTWTDTIAEGQPAATGTLRIQRRHGDEVVVIEELLGTVLLRIGTPGAKAGAAVTLTSGQSDVEVPVVLTQSGDCRPHALAESKHTFFIRAVVRVGDAADLVVYVQPEADDQTQLLGMINRACGVG